MPLSKNILNWIKNTIKNFNSFEESLRETFGIQKIRSGRHTRPHDTFAEYERQEFSRRVHRLEEAVQGVGRAVEDGYGSCGPPDQACGTGQYKGEED